MILQVSACRLFLLEGEILGIIQKGKPSSEKENTEKAVANEVPGYMIVPVAPGRIRIVIKRVIGPT